MPESPPADVTLLAPPESPSLQGIERLFDTIGKNLERSGQIGLLSVTVLERREGEREGAWDAYETVIHEVSSFLTTYRETHMRGEDRLLGPTANGNAFVLLLAPPRMGGHLDLGALSRVRLRLRRRLHQHLARSLPRETLDAFGWYVGGSLIRKDPSVRTERIAYRALEEAFANALQDRERESRRHATDLRRILELGLVRSVYQPVVDVVARKVIGLEALTRVAPGRFDNVELLFKAALDNHILWPLERLCRRKALEAMPRLAPDQALFLNVEPESMHDPDLLERGFLERLGASGLSPGQLVLEMTERRAVRDLPRFHRILERFRSLGFRVAMDDVGSGYAGLKALAEIAPDFIKVDMTLVRDVHRSALKREIIATVHRFSSSTGITLVAEGVETAEELEVLMDVGVRCAQGYLFSRPASPPPPPDWSGLPR